MLGLVPGRSVCIPFLNKSVVDAVVLCVQVLCFGTLSCYICIDWTVVRKDMRRSTSAYIIWRRVGLACMGWNMPALIEGNGEFSLMALDVTTLYGLVRK